MTKTNSSYLLFVLLFLCSCTAETKKETPPQAAEPKELTTQEKRDLAAKDWTPFWQMFQTAVVEGDVETLMKYIEFPLKGSEAFNDGKQISKATFPQHFSEIFDATARQMFKETDNMSDFATKNQTVADQLNVPVNKKIRTLLVAYIYEEGTENQTESSVTFQFVEVAPGEFKLFSLVTAG